MLQALLAVAGAIARTVATWRLRAARRRPLIVEISMLQEKVAALEQVVLLLRTRLARVPPKRRPQYRRHERLDILFHAARYGLSVERVAKTFVVSVSAIMNWRRDARRSKPRTVAPKSPVNKLPDLVGEITRQLKREWPRWGSRRIAGVLARLGIAISRTSVRKFLRTTPERRRPAAVARRFGAHVEAKHPGHLWFVDFTRVGGWFRSVVVAAVVDGFSRKVLGIGVSATEPTARFTIALLRLAISRHGVPTWIVTDHGTQFTSRLFRATLTRHGVRHRFGAVHRHGSLAVIERFWKSLKSEYLSRLHVFRPMRAIERRVVGYARWFNAERPHQGLVQRTPDELYYGRSTSARAAPLRGELVVENRILDDPEMPILRLKPAA